MVTVTREYDHRDGYEARNQREPGFRIHCGWHREIQQYQLGSVPLEFGQRLLAVAGNCDFMAQVPEIVPA